MINRELRQHGEMRGWLAPIEQLFEAAAAGKFAVPEVLTDGRQRLDQIRAALALVVWPPAPPEAAGEIAAEAGRDPAKIADDLGHRLLEAETAYEAARAQTQVLRIAETEVARELVAAYREAAEQIVVEGMRPALAKLLADAAKLVPKLQDARDPDALVALQDAAALKAWSELGLIAARYRAIRGAYVHVVRNVFRRELDTDTPEGRGLTTYRNFFELPTKQNRSDVQTPSAPAAFAAWLVTGDGGVVPEPWLPLPIEIEGALRDARERVRARQVEAQNRARSRQARRGQRERDQQEQREQQGEPMGAWRR